MGYTAIRWTSSLTLLVLAAVMPILASAVATGYLLVDRQLELVERDLRGSARTLLAAVDNELANQLQLAGMLAASPALDNDDLRAFHLEAERLTRATPGIAAVVLHDQNGDRQILNTRLPFGATMPSSVDPGTVQQVARSGQPVIGNLLPAGRAVQSPLLPVRVPVFRDGGLRWVLSIATMPGRFDAMIDGLAAPDEKLAGVFDANLTIVARSQGKNLVGKAASASFTEAARTKIGQIARTETIDGLRNMVVIERSTRTGWYAAVSLEEEAFWAPVYRTLGMVAGIGLAATLAALFLALHFGRRIVERAQAAEDERHAELKKAEDELQASHARMSAAVDLRGITIASYDRHLRYRWIYNPPADVAPETVLGRDESAVFEPKDALRLMTLQRSILAAGKRQRHEIALSLKGQDEPRHFDITGEPLIDEDGLPGGLLMTFEDIDDQVEARQKLQEAMEVAQRADRAKSRFLAAASHDLRQPLQAMRLFHLTLSHRVHEPQTRRAVTALGEAMDSAEELLNALLDVSTLEAGTVQPKIVDFPLHDMLSELGREYMGQAALRGLDWKASIPPAWVRSDRVLLKRMVRNLLENALRYTESGGLLLGCRRRGDKLLIQVWDTGMGIPAGRQEEIFEDFVQLGNPSRDRNKGLGLGLSVVQRMSRLLGHQVSLASRPGRGSVFTIAVPAVQPATEAVA